MNASKRPEIEDTDKDLSKKVRKKPSPKAQEGTVSQPDRRGRAKTFLEELQKEPPAETQEEPISEPGRMQKAKAFRKVLQDKGAQEESSSKLHVGIAGAMQKMLKEEAPHSGRGESVATELPLKNKDSVDVRGELDLEQQDISNQYRKTTEFTQRILHDIKEERPIRAEDVESEISQLADKLILGSQEMLLLSTRPAEHYMEDYPLSSMINVSILAMNIAMTLNYNKSKLVQLGSSAFMANVGMVRLLPIVASKTKLKQKEYVEVKKHPLYGAEILVALGFPEAYVKVALQHHERNDGSGYPNSLEGSRIDEFAGIVGLAEVVESLSHNRAYRSFIPIHQVIREVVENWRALFSLRIVRALVKALGIFPVGTEVVLSSGETAKIIRNNPASSLRPIVEVLGKRDGDTDARPNIIDLMDKPFVYIKGPVRGTGIPKEDLQSTKHKTDS
ncbi:MAG: hypothetical protein GY800_14190 [Planctomycetes bacterium]|nr:hypothetical protein [Planctomycetota bacterium]